MPGPPPPPPAAPPPACPPPPPVFNSTSSKSSDNRGALLSSIRQGAKLKKAVTNDRSAPIVGGKPSNTSNTSASLGGGFTSSPSPAVPNNLGLGGLFANGMPKLRPTGTPLDGIRNNDRNNGGFSSLNSSPLRPSNSNNNGGNSLPHMPAPKSFNNIQSEVQSALKKQMASDSNKNRGPPPPAPVRNNISQSIENLQNSTKPYHSRNNSSNGLHINSSTLHKSVGNLQPSPTLSPQIQSNFNNLQINSSTLHRKANSSANLTFFDSPDSNVSNNSLPSRPSNRKPHLAPKPPTLLNGKVVPPPKKLIMNGKHTNINRTQSMRSPRSPSPQSPEDFPTKFGTVRNMTSALDKSLGHNMNHRTRPLLNGRPTAPPPSIPFQQPVSSKVVKPPNHAPPPPPNVIPQPPSHAPPPPPSRINLQPQIPTRAPPCIPVSANAPPPPPRHSSMRDIPNNNKRTSPLDLDTKFRSEFHPVSQFPVPGIYRGLHKFYSNKTVNKQQAPLPPNHIQVGNRMWDTSTC